MQRHGRYETKKKEEKEQKLTGQIENDILC